MDKHQMMGVLCGIIISILLIYRDEKGKQIKDLKSKIKEQKSEIEDLKIKLESEKHTAALYSEGIGSADNIITDILKKSTTLRTENESLKRQLDTIKLELTTYTQVLSKLDIIYDKINNTYSQEDNHGNS